MSEISWIAATDQALRSAVNVAEAQRQMKYLEDAAAELPELLSSFRDIAEAASIMRTLGWAGRGLNPEVRKSLHQAVETLDNRAVQSSLRGVERFRSEVVADLTAFWSQYASDRLGVVGDLRILAGTLKEVDGVAELSMRLDETLGALARAQEALPTATSLELLRDAEDALRELEESLQPAAVRTFLMAVARGGAALDMLGQDVLAWLSSHNALGGFKIVAGHPSEAVDD